MAETRELLLGEDLESFRAGERTAQGEAAAGEPERAKRYKRIDRRQLVMRSVDVDKLVAEDHPVRAIWTMMCQLDMRGFENGVKAVEGGKGRSHWNPRLLAAMWIYGYSEAINSARELSRMSAYEPALQWLTGLEEVNYHTLTDFRVGYHDELNEMFTQVLGLLNAEGLTDLKRVMQDGTKVKAQASGNSYRREETIQEHLRLAREQVAAMEAADAEELSQRTRKARERAVREKGERLERALQELKKIEEQRKASEKPARVSETDPEARIMKEANSGFASSYNVQISTEASNNIIVAVAATQAGTDYDQLADGLDRVEANTGQTPEQTVVDGGYIKNANIEMAATRVTDLYGPVAENNPEASLKQRGIAPEFYPEKFVYDEATNTMACPTGAILTLKRTQPQPGRTEYHFRAPAEACAVCPMRQQCCPKSSPRWITRSEDSEAVKAFRAKMETAEAKAIYGTRAEVAETPNLWIKEKFGLRRFRLRGLVKVGMEAAWACLTYNIRQWIRLSWRPRLSGAVGAAAGVRA